MASWIRNKKSELTNIKQIEALLMNKPVMRATLNRYIASLDLQGQINRGTLTEQQAFKLFDKAIRDFSYLLNREINRCFANADNKKLLDQTDLSNPLNIQSALNNPDSIASQLMNDTVAAIVAACDEEMIENEQTNQQQLTAQQTAQEETANQATFAPTPKPTPQDSKEKEELLVGAVLGLTAGKEILEHTFEKCVGKKLEEKIGLSEEKENKSPFEIPVLKPKPPNMEDDK